MMKIPHFSHFFVSLLLGAISFLLPGCESKKPSSDAAPTDEPVTYEVDTSGSSDSLAAPKKPSGYTVQFQDILAKVNAQCPQEYPKIVTPVPDAHEIESMDSKTLMGMLESWNPVLRMEAAMALGNRDAAVIAELRQGTHSDNDKIRAGSATALAAICKKLAAQEIPADLASDFIRLSTDREHEVRVAALQALSSLTPKTRETTLAVLAMCTDASEYLAQDAMVSLNKYFEAHTLPIEDIEAGLKAAMDGPLPNGKGHIVQIISKLKPADQRRFIPELLAHLDWYTDRDTMFAGGGQELALQLLTKLEEPELIPRLPKLMGKKGRGHHLFSPALKSARAFGEKAKPLVPEFKAILKDLETHGKNAAITPEGDLKAGMDELKQTLIEIDSL